MSLHYHNHLTLGFAGKREHENLATLEAPLKELFQAFDHKMKRNHIRLVTGLADGADLIAAKLFSELFLSPKKRKHRAMGAILPFSEADFKQTLTLPTSRALFDDYYPLCDQQLELDGLYVAGKSKRAENCNNKGYAQQGKVLSRTADILIAVTLHDAAIKKGGTVETLFSALYLKKPVILFDLVDHKFYLYQSIEDWMDRGKPMEPGQIVETLCKLFPDTPGFQAQSIREGLVFIFRKMAWVFYERYFRGKKQPKPIYVELGALTMALFKKKKIVEPKLPPAEFTSLSHLLSHKQEQLDDAAQHYQFHYRGGYILNYFLALIAITLAVCSIVTDLEGEKLLNEKYVPLWLAIIGAFKLGVIILLIVNTGRINRLKYNKKAIDFRYAAERLRINGYMGLLGILRAPRPSLGNHSKKHFEKYAGEDMYQSAMRDPLNHPFKLVVTSPLLRESVSKLKEEWISGQLRYHRNEADLMTRMDERLEKIPAGLAVAVLVIVIVDLILGVGIELDHIELCPLWHERFIATIPIMLGLTALLPAIVTTLNSIRFQSDAHRLAVRSGIMVEELEQLEIKIADVENDVEGSDEGSNFGSVLDIMEEAASLLTDEVAEWSLIYEKRVYEQG